MLSPRAIACILPLIAAGSALAEHAATNPAESATKPAVTIDLADPQAALTTYFEAQKANDLPALTKATAVTPAEKKPYVDVVVPFQMWLRYLERQAIAKFGKDDGMRVEGHVRTLDDQTDLDLKRIKEANIEYNAEKNAATVFLRIEKNRPDNLSLDRFQFLDTYYLVKTTAGWQLDFVKTYKCNDPDMADNYKADLTAFPRMALNIKNLCAQLKAGKIKTADELKNMLEADWSHVYDAPTDATGHTAAETQAAPK